MDEAYPFCPECGYALSLTMEIDPNTDEILVNLFCEGPGDDEYHLQIQTGLTQYDLEDTDLEGASFPPKIVLVKRNPDPYEEV